MQPDEHIQHVIEESKEYPQVAIKWRISPTYGLSLVMHALKACQKLDLHGYWLPTRA